MPLQIDLPDDSLAGFSQPARDRLVAAALSFAGDLVDEANRLEAGRNSGAAPEVTAVMVTDANDLLRRGLHSPRKNSYQLKILRVASAVLPLLVGIMYDATNLQNGIYMLSFVTLVAVTILAVTLSVLKE